MDNQEYEKVQKQAQERKKRYLLRSLHRFRTAMVLSVVACVLSFLFGGLEAIISIFRMRYYDRIGLLYDLSGLILPIILLVISLVLWSIIKGLREQVRASLTEPDR